jgi:hypothetical protein
LRENVHIGHPASMRIVGWNLGDEPGAYRVQTCVCAAPQNSGKNNGHIARDRAYGMT